MARLLFFGDRVPRGALGWDAATLRAAEELGILRAVGEEVVPELVLRPQTLGPAGVDGWIVSDRDEMAGVSPLRADHVLGVGGAGRTLTSLLPRAGSGLALDLGCGCGIIALELRLRGYRVVATDVSERALRITAVNVALNGLDGVETRHGSLYDPVADERFALIASNPPFVVTPRRAGVTRYEYRDGGRSGDALMAEVVAGLAGHLAPGGQARVLGNWEGAADRVAGWASGVGTWVVERERMDPAAYAHLWIRDGGTLPGSAEYDDLLAAWLDDFEDRGVSELGMGWVIVTASDPALRRVEAVGQQVGSEWLGAHVAAALAVHEGLERMDDVALAASACRVAPDVTEARHHVPGEEAPSVIELRQGGGLGRTVAVDPALAAVVGACDGDLPLGALIDAVADLLEVGAAELRADILPRVRELLFCGFLTLD
ncbi:methyltransferase [Microbacterium sp. SORGH_AS_0888]|uniref:methyltransferase n=1 Tax=Microbacterium sp. SORGH_AS_0888 TaxID=3041791 RepID=UPI0027832EC9|nr:methyltransferase [Microbacterium sp. SORGH_AS_0888]MDQ1130028.1 methylase of polypeptide subunit release factors [Microbacterium sp. SORGH_AS_0888]